MLNSGDVKWHIVIGKFIYVYIHIYIYEGYVKSSENVYAILAVYKIDLTC